MTNTDRVIATTHHLGVTWLCNYYAARPHRRYTREDWQAEPLWLATLCRGVNTYVDSSRAATTALEKFIGAVK